MNSENQNIINQVTKFIKGGDTSDIGLLDDVLHEKFTNTQHGFFQQKGIFVMDKTKYLSLIEAGTFGGTPREIHIVFIETTETVAFVKANLKSEYLSFTSFISLIKDTDDVWKVIGNLPHITINN